MVDVTIIDDDLPGVASGPVEPTLPDTGIGISGNMAVGVIMLAVVTISYIKLSASSRVRT